MKASEASIEKIVACALQGSLPKGLLARKAHPIEEKRLYGALDNPRIACTALGAFLDEKNKMMGPARDLKETFLHALGTHTFQKQTHAPEKAFALLEALRASLQII